MCVTVDDHNRFPFALEHMWRVMEMSNSPCASAFVQWEMNCRLLARTGSRVLQTFLGSVWIAVLCRSRILLRRRLYRFRGVVELEEFADLTVTEFVEVGFRRFEHLAGAFVFE